MTTTAGSGLISGRPAADAAIEASRQALGAAGSDRADLALVFVTGEIHRDTQQVLHAVRRITGARVIVGCSGSGVLDERREVEGESAVAVLVVRDERLLATPFLVEDQAEAGPRAGARVAERVAGTVAEGGCLLVLPDVAGLDPRALLDGLQEALGFVPVVGAVAAGAPVVELFATQAVAGSLAGVALSGVRPVIGVAQGCAPIGEPYVVTRAADNVVVQIAGRRALDVLREAVQAAPGGPARARRGGVLAGLALDPAKSPLERGDFLVRNLLGVDASSGAIAIGERVHVGQTIQFQLRDADASREDLEATLGAVADRLGGRRPAFGCYFNCAGRGQGLYGVPDHDVALISGRLGAFPLVGFFGNGEFAPVGRRNVFHTYTGALVVFAG